VGFGLGINVWCLVAGCGVWGCGFLGCGVGYARLESNKEDEKFGGLAVPPPP